MPQHPLSGRMDTTCVEQQLMIVIRRLNVLECVMEPRKKERKGKKKRKNDSYGHLLAAVRREGLLVLQKNAKVWLPCNGRRLGALELVAGHVAQADFSVCK